jgi:hypothetical protein
MLYCYNCGQPAGHQRKFQDPRRGYKDELAYVRRFYCSDSCQEAIIDELELQAQYARVVN